MALMICVKSIQTDARASAKEQGDQVEDIALQKQRLVYEQRETARLRYKHALKKEVLKNVSFYHTV